MRVEQKLYVGGKMITNPVSDTLLGNCPQLLIAFASKQILEDESLYVKLRDDYPLAEIITCSTSGEIYGHEVYDDSASVTAIEFDKTGFTAESINIADYTNSFNAGQDLFYKVYNRNLSYMLVISDGALVNGSELIRGIESVNTTGIPVTGGLAGDADRFEYTLVGCNETPKRGTIVAIGFYGKELRIAHGSLGGWSASGPEQIVTRSVSNRLFEIDHQKALDVYKAHLGPYADELPASALLFPLSVKLQGTGNTVVRTILSIDQEQGCMVFAGDIPEGSNVQFMQATFDNLVDAATHAAQQTITNFHYEFEKPKLALLISCVGRKLILKERTNEETKAVCDLFGPNTFMTGFYSYGEISPLNKHAKCELHNQTMTITTLDEF